MASSAETALSSLLGPPPRTYRVSVISNAGTSDGAVAERVTEPGFTAEKVRPLGLQFPPGVFSLSHIALPFPPDDPLYGSHKPVGSRPEFGISLGAAALRGETSVLVVTLDTVMRLTYDPFFSYLMERIEETIATRSLECRKVAPVTLPCRDGAAPSARRRAWRSDERWEQISGSCARTSRYLKADDRIPAATYTASPPTSKKVL